MKQQKNQNRSNPLLWWVAVIALVLSGTLYYLLGKQAEIDVSARQLRIIFPLFGIIIAGVCLIVGTAGRWFYPK